MAVTPHDAEEALKPHLGRLHEAQERFNQAGGYANTDAADLIVAQGAALDEALDLLGVRA